MSKQIGGLGILGIPQLGTASKYVLEHNQTFWITNSGPLLIQAVPSTSTIRSMEDQSKQHSNRCNATVLEQNVSIYFPPLSLINRILKKVRQGKVEQMIIVTPTWQTQPWYPLLLERSMRCPLLLTPLQIYC